MSHNAAARAALKAMADAIGDRDGLSTLKEVFGAMDADGSGEIEGLEHFGAPIYSRHPPQNGPREGNRQKVDFRFPPLGPGLFSN